MPGLLCLWIGAGCGCGGKLKRYEVGWLFMTSTGLRKAVLWRFPLLISISLGKQFVLAVGQMNPLQNMVSFVRTADGSDEVEL